MKTLNKEALENNIENEILHLKYDELSNKLSNYNQRIKEKIDQKDPVGHILTQLKDDLKKGLDIILYSEDISQNVIDNPYESLKGCIEIFFLDKTEELSNELIKSVNDLGNNHKKLKQYINNKVNEVKEEASKKKKSDTLIPLKTLKDRYGMEYKSDNNLFKINLFIDDVHRYNFWMTIKNKYYKTLQCLLKKRIELEKIKQNPDFKQSTNGSDDYTLEDLERIKYKINKEKFDKEVAEYAAIAKPNNH